MPSASSEPPGSPPTRGLTRSIRVVELAGRTPDQDRRDPVRFVAGEGWPRWQRVAAGEVPDCEGVTVQESSA
jgi:hypothetical protein